MSAEKRISGQNKKRLQSTAFNYVTGSFAEWLDILGYSPRTVKGCPRQLQELFHYLESREIYKITDIVPRDLEDFTEHLQRRANLRYGGGLGNCTINTYVTTLNLFVRYLGQTGRHLLDISRGHLPPDTAARTILTREEIRQLYAATYEVYPGNSSSSAMGQRDRAILSVFYGCGLRKSEGSRLNLSDIDLDKQLLFVRRGKGNRQRYVPLAGETAGHLRSYLERGRYWFLQDNRSAWHVGRGALKRDVDNDAFFLNQQGRRMQGFYDRFSYLREKSGQVRRFSTHHLRHSIATHLLQSGMGIEEIARFLGHRSLESTQLYAQIVKQETTGNEG